MADLPNTLQGLQRALARGDLSVSEALQAQQERVADLDRRLGCVVSVPEAYAPMAGEHNKPLAGLSLAGVGLAHKDIFDTQGHRPGLGHDVGGPAPERTDAPALARLRRAGATHLARLAMAEHACGATGANPRLRPCINPRHPHAVVGGSSSGSAVAVASGLAYGSLGTDTAGSVRIPAAACGVLGLKTTHGLVSRQGVAPLAPALDSVGVLARTAGDAATLLSVVAERNLKTRSLAHSHKRPRLKAWLPGNLAPSVGAALDDFLGSLPQLQVQGELPEHRRLSELAEALMCFEAGQVHRTALLARQSSAAVEAVALPGLVITAEWAAAVQRNRAAQLRAFVAAHLQDHDLLLLPAFSHPVPDWEQVTPGAPEFDAQRLLGLYRYMGFVNYLGLPSLVVPIGVDERGLPVSVQVLARPFEDTTLLAWAAQHAAGRYAPLGSTPYNPSTV